MASFGAADEQPRAVATSPFWTGFHRSMTVLRHAPATLESLELSAGYAALGETFVEYRDPTPLSDPHLIATSPDAAALLGLNPDEFARSDFLRLAAGNARFSSVRSFAAVYAGHQFGQFVTQLGDGRAITLGEVRAPGGDAFEWQVKGAGTTAYSRFGDGRAVLRSTIREYLCSEAMAALGIPTTRALAIAGNDDAVFRERPETAAVLTRIAPSHLRFGNFEFFHHGGDFAAVKTLADYAIARFFPAVAALPGDAERYAAFLRAVVERTARLVARWQAVGFAHGVMNTDNMSILGLTLDYGPFGFLDTYEPGFICNHTDAGGRYAFERQPTIGLWNAYALAVALSSLVAESDAQAELAAYEPTFRDELLMLLRAKFGLSTERDDDPALFAGAYALLAGDRVDHTIFFRAFTTLAKTPAPSDDALAALFENRSAWYAWEHRFRERLASEPQNDGARRAAMRAANPKYVLRNYLAQRAIEAAERKDFSEIAALSELLRTPFGEHPEREADAAAPPDWARTIGVSCSS